MNLYQPGHIIIGRFEIKERLGAEGMGIVFGALDRELDEEIALKFLPAAMVDDPDAIRQFTREVRRARKVWGKYVLRVYDLWDDGEGGRFVTMEWAKGGDLNAYRRSFGVLNWEQAKTVLIPILHGLQTIHEAGIVHRDVKPGNILFREDWTPVVADFGISKSILASMSRISQDATIGGTPAYMAPEAIKGTSDIGPATDLYAVGCIAYELLNGHTPFQGDPMSVMYNQTHEDPSLVNMPVDAIRWIGACLIKDVSSRVQSAEALLWGLDDPGSLTEYGGRAPVEVKREEISPEPERPPSPKTTKMKTGGIPPTPPRRRKQPIVSEEPGKSASKLPWALAGIMGVLLIMVIFVATRNGGGDSPADVTARDEIQQSEIVKKETPPIKQETIPADPRARIRELEEKARAHFEAMRYTKPVGDNAWVICKQIREQESDNPVCADIMRGMREYYEGKIEESLADSECNEADEYASTLQMLESTKSFSDEIAKCRKEIAAERARIEAEREARAQAEQEGEEKAPKEREARERAARPLVEMIDIPGGSFRMGSNDGDSDEKPIHMVTISSFMMSKYEVTQGQYQTVMGSNPSHFLGSNRPVETVYWYDAVKFCNALSKREGLTPCYSGSGINTRCNWNANGYRLPTEAEWEYACRAGTTTEYHTGNGSSALDRAGWYPRNSDNQTHEVGRKQANKFGLYDMHGNVWEWCWDWYGSYSSGTQTDPKGPSSGSYRVDRGGGWGYNAWCCRSAYRYGDDPGYRWFALGFRLVRR